MTARSIIEAAIPTASFGGVGPGQPLPNKDRRKLLFKQRPQNQAELEDFLCELQALGLQFHLDDDPSEVISGYDTDAKLDHDFKKAFSPVEAAVIRAVLRDASNYLPGADAVHNERLWAIADKIWPTEA